MDDIAAEIHALQQMPMAKLVLRYAEVFGEPTATRNRLYLLRKIAWRVQMRAYGGLSERARQTAERLARGAEVRVTGARMKTAAPLVTPHRVVAVRKHGDPRLPPIGTAITRQYKGRTIHVLVESDGFTCDGRRYKTLTSVAESITGSHINGFRFFKLEAE